MVLFLYLYFCKFVFLYFCILSIIFILLKRMIVCRWLAIPVNKQRGIGPQSARLELTFPLVGGQARHEKSGDGNEEDLQQVECKSHVIGLTIDPGPGSWKEDSPGGQHFFLQMIQTLLLGRPLAKRAVWYDDFLQIKISRVWNDQDQGYLITLMSNYCMFF